MYSNTTPSHAVPPDDVRECRGHAPDIAGPDGPVVLSGARVWPLPLTVNINVSKYSISNPVRGDPERDAARQSRWPLDLILVSTRPWMDQSCCCEIKKFTNHWGIKLNDVLVPAPPKREGTGLKEWDESLLALGITVHGSTDAARVRSALSQACAAGASLRVLGTLLDILRFIPCKPGKVSFAGDTKAVSVKELVSRPCAWDGDHVDWCPGGFSGSNTHGHFQNADWC